MLNNNIVYDIRNALYALNTIVVIKQWARCLFVLVLFLSSQAIAVAQTQGITNYSDYVRSISIDSLLQQAEYLRTRNPKQARDFAQAAYNRALSADNGLRQAQALVILGYISWVQGLYEESLRTSLQALRLTEKEISVIPDNVGKDTLERQVCILSRQIGNVYALQKQYDMAINFFQSALKRAQKLNDTALIVLGLNNVGAIYYYRQQYDSAIAWYEKSLAYFSSGSLADYTALSYLNLAQAHSKKGLYEEAFYYASRALFICNSSGEKRYAVVALHTIAISQRKQKRFFDAEYALKRSLVLADSLGSRELLRDSYEEWTALEEGRGNFAEALRYHRLFKAMNDSMFSEQSATRIAALSAIHQEEEQRQEIELLRQTTRNQHFQRNSLVGGVIVLIVFLVLVWNRYRIKRQSEYALKQKNDAILQQQNAMQEQAEEIARINVDVSQRNEALNHANREKNDLMGIVAHDLKNPLAGIQGLASIILLEQRWNENVEQAVKQIILASQRMFSLIENLLDVNALESGSISFALQSLDGASIVRSIVEQLRPSASKKNIQIQLLLIERDSILVYADRNALVQVTENLISNAIKYSPHGSLVTVRLKQQSGTEGMESCFRMEVQDQGPGISEDDRKKLFGKFVRLTAQPTGGEHSTGLGLSIVKKLVDGMQGYVWCESAVGKGSMFIVELPQV